MTSSSRNSRIERMGMLVAAVSLILILVGLSRMESNAEDVFQWLPDKSRERAEFAFFEKHFASDDFLVITWEGCSGEDRRLGELAQYLRDEQQTGGLIQGVKSGPEIASELVDALGIRMPQAQSRLAGFLFGTERRDQTCLLIELTTAGTHDRPGVMEAVERSIAQVEHLDRSKVVMGGYPYVSTYLDDQVNRSFAMLLFPSFVMATVVSLLCLRDLRLAIALFIASGLAAGLSLALVPLCGAKFSGLTSIIPTLAFVLTNSGGLHLIRYSLTCIGDPWALIRIGWKPCLISTATTAIGMLSLIRSEFPAIREFGFFCALGVGVAFVFQMTIVPWLLWRLGQNGLARMASRDFESAWWQRFLHRVHGAALPIVAVSLFFGALSFVGLFRLHAEVEAEALFAKDSEIIQSLHALEEQMGPLDQVELLLMFDRASEVDFSRRLDFVRALQIDLASRVDVSIVHSLANYLPSRPRPAKGARAIAEMNAYEHVLADRYPLLAQSGLLSKDSESEVWRLMIRVPFTRQVDFEQLKGHVIDATQAFEQAYKKFDAQLTMPRVKFTGKNYLFHTAQRKLLIDLFWNFLLAFAIITPLMVLVLRSVSLGLIAMIPNMAPMMLIFGGMGFLGLPVDIAIAMTASVALGIAVDDTAHFLIRFRDFDGRQGRLEPAMTRSIGQCGPAMFYTTVMSGAGIFVNYFSELYVVSRFAATLSLLLVVALIADVVMLPAILYFVDRWFRPGTSRSGPSDTDESAELNDAMRTAV